MPVNTLYNGKHVSDNAIVLALGTGASKRSVARKLHVSRTRINNVEDREWDRIDARKQLSAAREERTVNLSQELILTKLEAAKPDDYSLPELNIVKGTAIDKMLALRCEPSMTIHHELTLSTDDKLLEAMHAANARAEKRAKAAVVEVPALPAETGNHSKRTPRKKKANGATD